MSEIFTIKQNDTSPAILYDLSPASEVILTGASVVFNMRDRDPSGSTVISRAPAIIVTEVDAPRVKYKWAAGDTAAAGAYFAEFEVTYIDGSVETFPNDGYIFVRVDEDIA